MTAPELRPCSEWIADEDVPVVDGVEAEERARVIRAATEIVWWLSGRRFGQCSVKIRPCRSMAAERCQSDIIQWPFTAPWGGMGYYPSLPYRARGAWYNAWGCTHYGGCDCRPTNRMRLPKRPVCSVDEVMVDGEPLIGPADEGSGIETAQYRVDDFRWLVRTDGESWLLDQDLDLDDTEVGTWSVTFTYGRPVPEAGWLAVRELAHEMLKSFAGAACALPQRVQSVTYENATVSMIDPQTFLTEGRTGLYLVDLFIKAVNPDGKQNKARIFRADAPGFGSKRVGT